MQFTIIDRRDHKHACVGSGRTFCDLEETLRKRRHQSPLVDIEVTYTIPIPLFGTVFGYPILPRGEPERLVLYSKGTREIFGPDTKCWGFRYTASKGKRTAKKVRTIDIPFRPANDPFTKNGVARMSLGLHPGLRFFLKPAAFKKSYESAEDIFYEALSVTEERVLQYFLPYEAKYT